MPMIKPTLFAAAASFLLTWQTNAQEISEEQQAFVEANVLSIFYHELGHAVIDLMEVPIFGQEEDAADMMSVLLMDWLFDEEIAQDIAYDSAFGHINDPEQTQEVAYWDLHGPDEQRYYNHVCIFYGANTDEREELAFELGLPEERAETCPDEYDQAADAWGAIFSEMDNQTTGEPMIFEAGSGHDAAVSNRVLAAEVANMNGDLKLPQSVTVRVIDCDEANAFYDPQDISITFCNEFVPHLEVLHEKLSNK